MTGPRHLRLLLIASITVLATAGCTSAPVAAPSPDSNVDPQREVVLTKLGPYPADTQLTEAEKNELLTTAADGWWSFTVGLFPDAQRPSVELEEEVSDADYVAVFGTCLEEAGISLAGSSAGEYVPTNVDEGIAWYTCKVRFPVAPEAPANDEQLGYIYDYLTLFVAPCLEERGSVIAPPPTREDFISLWPNQNWFPEPTTAPRDSKEYASQNAECPSTLEF